MTRSETNNLSELIELTDRLTDLISAEVAALRAMRPQDIFPLQDEKSALTSQMEVWVRDLREHPEPIVAADPERRAALQHSTTALSSVVTENLRVLDAAQSVNERMFKAIAEAVNEQSNPATSYAPNGDLARPGKQHLADAVPLTLDQRV